MHCLPKYYPKFLTNWLFWVITLSFCWLALTGKAYCYNTISFKQDSIESIPMPNKIDLTTLPIGKTFRVNHPKFTLEFFFNNRDIFGFITKREFNFGIIAHLCFFRSCQESPYDINQVVAMPQEPVSDRTFFMIKLPHGLQYNFQGIEFLPIN